MSPCTWPASREHGLKKASFSMGPLLHADILEYLCSFQGGMEDPSANQQMLHKVLAIKEQHFGEHHWQVACTLNNLAVAHMRLGDHRTQKRAPRPRIEDFSGTLR